jgi:hypothetical protein
MTRRLIFIALVCFVFSCKKTAVVPTYHPIPRFDIPRAGYYIGETITLTVSNPASNEVYSWDFGDGDTAQGATITHRYATTGSYRITLADQLNGFDRGGVIKFINIFPGNASFRLINSATTIPFFQVCFFTHAVPVGAIPDYDKIAEFRYKQYTSNTDTTIMNMPDDSMPLYINIIGNSAKGVQFTYTALFDKSKLYQNQDIELTDATMVYTSGFFNGPQIPFGSY